MSAARTTPRHTRLPWWALLSVAAVAAVAACSGDDGGDSSGSRADRGSVEVRENGDSTLSAIVGVTTEVPSRASLTTRSDGHEVTIPGDDELATSHELALVGLRPETRYEVVVTAVDEDGAPIDVGEAVDFTAGSLPDDFPPLSLEADTERAAEGLTLISLKPWGEPDEGQPEPATGTDAPQGYLAAVDHEGFVVWYHPTELGVLDARQLDDGTFLYTYDELVVRQVDVLGRVVNELVGQVAAAGQGDPERPRFGDGATTMATDSAHHDAGQLANGNILLLSTELREVSGPPLCDEDAEQVTYPVIADVVAEVDPDSGEVVGEWSLFDVYDPFDRPGSEMCAEGVPFAPPNFFYADEGKRDWTHGNSVVLDEDRNALILSLRHLSAVLAIRYQADDSGPAGELLWEIGPDGALPLDGEPSYYQHAASVLGDGSILVYDNGNTRPGASLGGDGDPPYSRAVIYEVDDGGGDPSAWRARQVWEHILEGDGGRPVFTAFLGDADGLDNGNVLITHGALMIEGALNARVVEVTRAASVGGDVVWDLRVGDATNAWTVYRSQRIRSLTPTG